MENIENKIRISLQKREDALNRFKARKIAFLLTKKQTVKDINAAKEIWQSTLEQLPEQEFN
jgi:hypothetical protein